jgi:hypothetical protein
MNSVWKMNKIKNFMNGYKKKLMNILNNMKRSDFTVVYHFKNSIEF